MECPDRWVLCKITTPKEAYHRVFAGWYGGYSGSDSWKFSSKITNSVETPDHFEHTTQSGNTYVCYKNSEGMSAYMSSVYASYEAQNSDLISISVVGDT